MKIKFDRTPVKKFFCNIRYILTIFVCHTCLTKMCDFVNEQVRAGSDVVSPEMTVGSSEHNLVA